MVYILQKSPRGDIGSVLRVETSTSIPFVVDNTDYQTFKREVAAGTPLEDPEGNVMTQEEVNAFLETIP